MVLSLGMYAVTGCESPPGATELDEQHIGEQVTDFESAIACPQETFVVPLLQGSRCPSLEGHEGRLVQATSLHNEPEPWCSYPQALSFWADRLATNPKERAALETTEDCPLARMSRRVDDGGLSPAHEPMPVLPNDPACPECTLDDDVLTGSLDPVHAGRTVVKTTLIFSGATSQRTVNLGSGFPSKEIQTLKLDAGEVALPNEAVSLSVEFDDAAAPIIQAIRVQ